MLTDIHRAMHSELVKITRPRLLVPFLLSTALLAALAAGGWATVVDAPGQAPGGPLQPMRVAAPFIGLLVMGVSANSFCDEYREGTWKVLLIRHPRQPTLLLGKLSGLLALAAAAALTGCTASGLTAWSMVIAQGEPTAAWASAAGIGSTAGTALRVTAGFLAYATIGSAAGLVLRSAAAALGSLLGWILIGESALNAIAATRGLDLADWLPGSAVTRFMGGTDWQLSAAATALWCTLLFAGAVCHFRWTARPA
ncbi:ABC transporter permease [Streptomyces pathocidini]|uniref:ABC transporter permease n=1 Tax=Streptomyces pathocidini TaxID=1650571 RepID=UPI0033FEB12B